MWDACYNKKEIYQNSIEDLNSDIPDDKKGTTINLIPLADIHEAYFWVNNNLKVILQTNNNYMRGASE